jgi:hypothetical protein
VGFSHARPDGRVVRGGSAGDGSPRQQGRGAGDSAARIAYARALLLAWGGAHRERWEDPEPRARLVAELVVHDHTADRRASLRIAPPPMKPTPAAAWAATRMGSTLQPRWTAAHP